VVVKNICDLFMFYLSLKNQIFKTINHFLVVMLEKIAHTVSGRQIKSRIALHRLGVILVDMQTWFLSDIDVVDRKTMFSAQSDVLVACAKMDYPLVVLEYVDWGDTDPRLKEAISEVPRYIFIQKSQNDGFTNPKLAQQLDEWSIDYLCFMGIGAARCVKETASSAIAHGKKILTARQLIASQTYNQKEFRKSIPWFEENGVYLQDYSSLVYLMSKKE
jgi:nicotinamidase-related amidase